MKLRQALHLVQTRIDALSLRERGILFLVGAMLLYFLWDTALMTPQEEKQKALLKQINAVRNEAAALDRQALTVLGHHSMDPNADEREQLKQLDISVGDLEQQLKEAISGLIEPQQMASVLEAVLAQQKALTFVRIENLGAEPLLSNPQSPDTTVSSHFGGGIYKHSMRLEMQGNFADTVAYLRTLESLSWQFRWDEVELTMLDYPTARIVVTVHTLSLQEGWLGV